MKIRTLAASAAVLMFATGGALAQAAADADTTCATLNGMAEAERLAFAQEYIDSIEAGAASADAAARTSQPQGDAGNAGNAPAAGDADQAAAPAAPAAPAAGNDDADMAAATPTPEESIQKGAKGEDAQALIEGCAGAPDKTFADIVPATPAPGQ